MKARVLSGQKKIGKGNRGQGFRLLKVPPTTCTRAGILWHIVIPERDTVSFVLKVFDSAIKNTLKGTLS